MKTSNLYLLFFINGLVNSTLKRSRSNLFLDIKKRYLSFPKGTNFVINLSLVKSLLRDSPPINMLLECDVPFPLPSKEDYIREKHDKNSRYIPHHFRQRRKIYMQLEHALDVLGMDGKACLQRFLCEFDAHSEILPYGNVLVLDILRVIFDLKGFDKYYGNYFDDKCTEKMFENCEVSFLDLLLKSL